MPKTTPKAKRASVTDGMATVTEKLASGVERKLIKFVERDGFWVVEPGDRGHSNYIYNIRERLKADNFTFDGKLKKWKKATATPLEPTSQKHELDTSGFLPDEELLKIDIDAIAAHYHAKSDAVATGE